MNIYNKLPEDLQYYMIEFIKERYKFTVRDKRAMFTKTLEMYQNYNNRISPEMYKTYAGRAFYRVFIEELEEDQTDFYMCPDCDWEEHCEECCPCELCEFFYINPN